MKKLTFLILTLLLKVGFSQKVEWREDYLISLSDFQNEGTEINDQLSSYSLSDGTYMEFGMQKNAYSFAFSKNFNRNVTAVFNKTGAMLVAPDSAVANQLLSFARYSFDLTELYARKFRKRMYEEKETFSSADFYQPIFEEINNELSAEHARVLKLTDLGREEGILKLEHQKVKGQIQVLSDFCKSCKPPKRRKK